MTDVVMLAMPVGAMPSVLGEVRSALRPGAIVTDVGSTKSDVIAAARAALGRACARFVPGHPIAGRELPGVEHAEPGLFRDKLYVCVPLPETDPESIAQVESLWRSAGCRIEHMSAEEHDRVFASVSHLPHLLAFALVAQIAADPEAERKFALAGAGFRDFTRIAASSPTMWRDICLANRAALTPQLADYRALLDRLVLADLHVLDATRRIAERDRIAHSALAGVYLAVFDGAAPIACGSLVVEGEVAGIFGMVTRAALRGRGLATHIVAALLQRARAAGVRTVYLQVDAGNAPARRACSKFGFTDRYAYWYRYAPAAQEEK